MQYTCSSFFSLLLTLLNSICMYIGIPLPSKQLGDRLFPVEGKSMVPALTSLEAEAVHDAVYSQFPRNPANDSIPWESNGIGHSSPSQFKYMGYSVR